MQPVDSLISSCHDLDSLPRLDNKSASDFFHEFPLSDIFELLSTGMVTERPMHVISSVLDRLLTTTEPGRIILSNPATSPFLQAALHSSFPSLRRLAVHTMSCSLSSFSSLDGSESILLQLISSMADADTGVAVLAEVSISSWADGSEEKKIWILRKLSHNPITENPDSTVRLRALSLAVTISARGEGSSDGGIGGQVSKGLLRELGTPEKDPLSALACLESISTKLTSMSTSHQPGLKLKPLMNEVLLALSLTLSSLLNDPICRSMAISSTAEILGCAISNGSINGEEALKIETLLLKTIRSILADSAQGSSIDDEVNAVDACTRMISLGGHTAAEVILSDPVIASALFERAFEGSRSSSDQVKVVALHAVSTIACHDLSMGPESTLRKLIYQSSPVHGPTEALSKLISLPFEEMKEAALRALHSMLRPRESRLYFGADTVRNQSLMALLLNSESQQSSPRCAMLRHAILEDLVNMSCINLLGQSGSNEEEHAHNIALIAELLSQIKAAAARGPYGVMRGKDDIQDPQVLVASRV